MEDRSTIKELGCCGILPNSIEAWGAVCQFASQNLAKSKKLKNESNYSLVW